MGKVRHREGGAPRYQFVGDIAIGWDPSNKPSKRGPRRTRPGYETNCLERRAQRHPTEPSTGVHKGPRHRKSKDEVAPEYFKKAMRAKEYFDY